MDDYYEDDYDLSCPYCDNPFIRWRHCDAIGCDDGLIDAYEDDPLWYNPGDYEPCLDCRGTGIQHWCPVCGQDYIWQDEPAPAGKDVT